MLGKHQLISIPYLQLSLIQILPMMQCISSSGDPQAKGTCEKSYLLFFFSDRARGGTHNQETSEDAQSGIDGSNMCHHLNREIHRLLCFPSFCFSLQFKALC